MRPEELMIGDWVQNTNGNKGKVIGFRYDTCDNDNEIVISYRENDTTWSSPSLIKPIPIDGLVLEKNGIKLRQTNDVFSKYELWIDMCYIDIMIIDDHSVIDIKTEVLEEDGRYGVNSVHKIAKYIHELQHALKMCSLTDLADKLVI